MNVFGQAWAGQAACASGTAASLPWVADAGMVAAADIAAMTRVCGDCLVVAECGGAAVSADAGFWAGRCRDVAREVVVSSEPVGGRGGRLGARQMMWVFL